MNYTSDHIELMDKVFDYYIAHNYYGERRNPSASLFSKLFMIDRITAQFAINEVCSNGHLLNLLTAQKFSDGDWEVVKMDKIKCITFQSQGGFKKYFTEKENNTENGLSVNKNLNLGDNFGIIFYGGQPTVENIDQSRPVNEALQEIKSPCKKSLSLITARIFKHIVAIIIAVLTSYLIYKLGWN